MCSVFNKDYTIQVNKKQQVCKLIISIHFDIFM